MTKTIIATAILYMLLSGASEARDRGDGGARHLPPQVALDACADEGQGASCSFEGRRGDTLTGTCRAIQQKLACVPKGHRGDGPPQDGDRKEKRF